jgi:hypothetical protein
MRLFRNSRKTRSGQASCGAKPLLIRREVHAAPFALGTLGLLALGLAAVIVPARAHHSMAAMYDDKKRSR